MNAKTNGSKLSSGSQSRVFQALSNRPVISRLPSSCKTRYRDKSTLLAGLLLPISSWLVIKGPLFCMPSTRAPCLLGENSRHLVPSALGFSPASPLILLAWAGLHSPPSSPRPWKWTFARADRRGTRAWYEHSLFQKSLESPMLNLMRKVEITDEHWRRLEPLLPPPRRGRGRPRADDRKTLNGILYVLRTGCRWGDVPRKYGSPTTCWPA